jgi:hypothetical protein
MPLRATLAFDDMVDFLADLDKFTYRTVTDPRLWGEKKSSHHAAEARHRDKRQRLPDYYPHEVDETHKSQSLSVFNLQGFGNFKATINKMRRKLLLS